MLQTMHKENEPPQKPLPSFQNTGTIGRPIEAEAPALSRNIRLQGKALCTTEDAVVLHSAAGKEDACFTNACRIIHGPGGLMTRKPYLILFRDEPGRQVEEIIKGLLKGHPEEFPDPDDSYAAPILHNGIYYDERIRWITI